MVMTEIKNLLSLLLLPAGCSIEVPRASRGGHQRCEWTHCTPLCSPARPAGRLQTSARRHACPSRPHRRKRWASLTSVESLSRHSCQAVWLGMSWKCVYVSLIGQSGGIPAVQFILQVHLCVFDGRVWRQSECASVQTAVNCCPHHLGLQVHHLRMLGASA